MITIKTEFETRTTMGLTKCTADKTIYRNYRDIENVDEAVAYVKKLFNGKLNDPFVDFICDAENGYGRSVIRFFHDWKDGKQGFSCVMFDEKTGAGTKFFMEKLTTKDIRDAYLECANRQLSIDEGKEVG